jgi:hypothetical protein
MLHWKVNDLIFEALFEQRKKFGEIVYRSRYDVLSNYVLDFVCHSKPFLEKVSAFYSADCIEDRPSENDPGCFQAGFV